MLIENEQKSSGIENGPILILGVIFVALVLMTFCALSVMLINQLKAPRPTTQQENPVILIATASLPKAMPANHFSIRLPMVLSGSGSISVTEQIWIVTKIHPQGYELDGQRYDLATFTLINSQDTLRGYCINPGWDIPDIGTEYLLTAGGTFVPLQQPKAHPFQSFLKIQ